MKRLPVISLLFALLLCGCNIYHYSKVVPGENVVFSDKTTVSGATDNNPSYSGYSANTQAAASSDNSSGSSNEYHPGPLTQEIDVASAQAEAAASDNGIPAWTRKQAYDEIERGKQVFYGVGLSYYQAPTKKELDKARSKAEQTATDKLTEYVLANFSNTKTPLEGVTVAETWQDLEQMALYTLVRYVNK